MKSENVFSKAVEVIRSCKTNEQLDVARTYASLANKILEDTATYLFYDEVQKQRKKINN